MPRSLVAAAAVAGSLLSLVAFAPNAAAAGAGWSRSPSAGIAGATIRVASSPTTLCQWLVPAPPPTAPTSTAPDSTAPASSASIAATPSDAIGATAVGDPIAYDGVRVELRFERDGVALPLGNVPVTSGGAWSGSVTVPAANFAPAGIYDLLAHCVVDDPALDGVHSYDFDPLPFVVVEAPPPTTVTVPTEIGEPVTVTNPVQVQGAQLDHSAIANQPAAAPTLPNTGDGTLTVAIAGFAALFLGGLALWWGARTSRERASI